MVSRVVGRGGWIPVRVASALPGIVVGLLGGLVVWSLLSGTIHLYVQERSAWLVALSAPLLLALGVVGARRGLHGPIDRLGVAVLAVPLAIGLLLPARPLGSAALDLQHGATTARAPAGWASRSVSGPSARPGLGVPDLPPTWALGALDLDLRQLGTLAAQDPALRGLDGQRVTLLGFVYRAPDTPADRFLVGRFVVRCCTADAVPLSFPVRFGEATALERDTWVEVTGTLGRAAGSAAAGPIVEADRVTVVPQPSRPYLYP